MSPRIEDHMIVDGELQIDVDAVRSFKRTDITLFGWIYVFVVVFVATWISGIEGVQWWMGTIGAIVCLLLAAFVIPLSCLELHTAEGSVKLRGTTSRLHDITDVLSARSVAKADGDTTGNPEDA